MNFSAVLLDWFARNGRDLPWRDTSDPYAIWLSEVILQQTRIAQGRDYWVRFMKQFPGVNDLAAASEDEVLRLWQGLGYYSRARNLHTAAKQIVALGRFPDTFEEIKQLKGVGDYTAAAIASIAFGLPVAVVDGNVYRVLSRYFGIETPINSTEGKKEFAALAQSLLPKDAPSAFNQAMMDFGALQCVVAPGATKGEDQLSFKICVDCPLIESCAAYRTGRVNELPVKLKTTKIKTRHLTYIYIRCNGETAIRRRASGDIWQGLWEPYLAADVELTGDKSFNAGFPSIAGAERDFLPVLLRRNFKHVLTHRILLADFYLLETDSKPTLPDGYVWIREHDIERYAVPRLIEILLESLP
ncbi:MAG: A/G-specific adenine glycosylase [Prevotella pleuritidis]|jgi:A/G-specific adenine glycosylase|uniref:Adenine DNA glycosylase n=1 Tax=Hoylesella pleuritidis F0068 TaxID=1081904 RepID=U2LGV8_9BACT|nr:A/G-specific adenine glycosylase [Hoylesella pleuritidis]ERK03516.1 A/G-specific adenine glycosylase [Hoylesella pleuritidis F0068]MBF1554601.1 A/G-specific adenine glycosylase [Hoylesella pleuritidis]